MKKDQVKTHTNTDNSGYFDGKIFTEEGEECDDRDYLKFSRFESFIWGLSTTVAICGMMYLNYKIAEYIHSNWMHGGM